MSNFTRVFTFLWVAIAGTISVIALFVQAEKSLALDYDGHVVAGTYFVLLGLAGVLFTLYALREIAKGWATHE